MTVPEINVTRENSTTVSNNMDLAHGHFLGKLPYVNYIHVLRVSAAHLYSTYPFVLASSFLEARAIGCKLIASRTSPVIEYSQDCIDSSLIGFFDEQGFAKESLEIGGQQIFNKRHAKQPPNIGYALNFKKCIIE